MIYLALTVLSYHLLLLPLLIGVEAHCDSDSSDGSIRLKLYFIPVFKKRTDFKKLRAAINGEPVSSASEKSDAATKKPSRFKKALMNLLKDIALDVVSRIRVKDMDMKMRIGAGDAAATAFAASSAKILYSQACAYINTPENGEISPDYDAATFFMRFSGIFLLTVGDIIFAVSSVLWHRLIDHGRSKAYGNSTNRV